jgi:RHS repeat-associated protein
MYIPKYTNRFVWHKRTLLAVLGETPVLKASFVRNGDGLEEVISANLQTNGVGFCVYDSTRNITALVKGEDGKTSGRYEYDPFGRTLRLTGSAAKENPLRFGTQFGDEVRDTWKYLYRDYHGSFARWPTIDPIEERGGLNMYCFLANNGVSRFDAHGLAETPLENDPVFGSPDDPDVSPCRWLGKFRGLPAGVPQSAWAVCQFRTITRPGFTGNSKSCCACSGKSGSELETRTPNCTIKIYIAQGHEWWESTPENPRRRVWDHEVSHARFRASEIASRDAVYKALAFCVPDACSLLRINAAGAFDSYHIALSNFENTRIESSDNGNAVDFDYDRDVLPALNAAIQSYTGFLNCMSRECPEVHGPAF